MANHIPKPITPEVEAYIKENLEYDPKSPSCLRWIKAGTGRPTSGIAGCLNGGYWMVKVLGCGKLAHHIIWLLCKGHWPTNQLDHIDNTIIQGVGKSNKISNLSDEVSFRENTSKDRTNKTGFLGVFFRRKTYGFRLWHGEKQLWFGKFRTAQEASNARKAYILKNNLK